MSLLKNRSRWKNTDDEYKTIFTNENLLHKMKVCCYRQRSVEFLCLRKIVCNSIGRYMIYNDESLANTVWVVKVYILLASLKYGLCIIYLVGNLTEHCYTLKCEIFSILNLHFTPVSNYPRLFPQIARQCRSSCCIPDHP